MNNGGFTLVEVIVSILILGIVVIGIFPMFSQAFSSIFSSGDKVQQVHSVKNELLKKLFDPDYTDAAIETENNMGLDFVDSSNSDNNFSLTTKKYSASGAYKLPGGKESDIQLEYYILE